MTKTGLRGMLFSLVMALIGFVLGVVARNVPVVVAATLITLFDLYWLGKYAGQGWVRYHTSKRPLFSSEPPVEVARAMIDWSLMPAGADGWCGRRIATARNPDAPMQSWWVARGMPPAKILPAPDFGIEMSFPNETGSRTLWVSRHAG